MLILRRGPEEMGCSTSRIEDEEAVQLCRDRRSFIKQAVEQRCRFALSHVAYLESLSRLSLALLDFVEGNGHRHGAFADHYATPPFTPERRTASVVVNRLMRSGVNPSIPVEEWPGSPETARVESYYASDGYGIGGGFTYEPSRPSYPPSSPQSSQWDSFWDPFSSLERYRFQSRAADGDVDEMAMLRKVREEEGIPELEESDDDDASTEGEDDDSDDGDHEHQEGGRKEDESSKPVVKPTGGLVSEEKKPSEPEAKGCQAHGAGSVEVSGARDAVVAEASAEDTPGFTVYVNRRPESMTEVIKDVGGQFERILDSARDVSVMLEASRAQYSARYEITGSRRFNPAALFRSPSSRSSSFRFLQADHPAANSRDDGEETGSNYSEECCMASGSHQATLDRLFAWEKRLFDEVKCGERVRIEYEKQCARLRRHDANGEEPCVVDRTRAAIRDLGTRLKVSMHSVESVSMRIEALRDGELHPQLMELIQGLARMWRTMADCHRIQKRTIDEAKLILFSSSAATASADAVGPRMAGTSRPLKYASNLVFELGNWRSCLDAWIGAQRAYARALAGWISRCSRPQVNAGLDRTAVTESPSQVGARAPPVFGICVRWARLLDSVREAPVMEGISLFATGIGSVSVQQGEGAVGPAGAEGAITAPAEGAKEIGERVMCAGMAAAVGSLTEFATSSAAGYEALVKKFEDGGMAGRVDQ